MRDHEEIWCKECQKYTITEEKDVGIGPYECHGYCGTHKEYVSVCSECGEDADFDATPCSDCKEETCKLCS